jgi:hypothetical protein
MFFYFFFVASVLSLLPGYVGASLSIDRINYINMYSHFDSIANIMSSRIEVGFSSFMGIFKVIGLSAEAFLTGISILITLTLYSFFIRMIKYKDYIDLYIFSCFFFICLYSSSWYFTGVTNGIRQCMAVSLLFYSLIFYNEKKYILFIMLSLFSALLHSTNFLLIPFLFLLNSRFFSLKISSFMFIFFAFGYILDFNQYVVKFASDITGLHLYSAIKDYDSGDLPSIHWYGFDIRFFMYNVFWFMMPFILGFFKVIKIDKNMVFVLKVYSLLSIFYFIFGFAAYSNRWAYPSWLFIPILQAYLLSSLRFSYTKINMILILVVSTVLFFISIFFYVSKYLGNCSF